MGLFGRRIKKEQEEFSLESQVSSSYASFEAALRDELETTPENVAEPTRLSLVPEADKTPRGDFSRVRRVFFFFAGLVIVLGLAWAVGFGPLSPLMRQMLAQLNQRAMAPITTETTAPPDGTESVEPTTPSTPADTLEAAVPASATPAPTNTPAPTATADSTPTPADTATAEPTLTPTSPVTGCVPAAAITLDDVGKELCVTAFVFNAEVFDTYFSVRTGEDFYYVSYAKGWYKDYGVTWEFEKGECVYATGKIEQIGSFPLMQVGYKNPLQRCEEP